MLRKFIFILVLILTFSCDESSKVEKEIEKIPVDFEVVRFDKKFAEVTPKGFPRLKAEFPFLFPAQYPDSVWIAKINDTIQQELNTEVLKAYPEFSKQEDELNSLFQHLSYYFPSFKAPTIFTVTSEVDYKNKVLLANDYLFISLDTYLGKEHPFYIGIQEYLKKNFEESQILPDVAAVYAEQYVPKPANKSFLSHMVYYGKILYVKELLLPEIPAHEKMGYTEDELEWVQANEEQIWRYFVERELIFESDTELYTRFLYPAPFSKFYLELDSESPDRVGQYIGWKIIKQYMKKTDSDLQGMLITNAETIFNKANYKPRK
jgi:gliding motility-associated lipoprotein GldB